MIDLLLAVAASVSTAQEGPTTVCTSLARIAVARGSRVDVSRTAEGVTYTVSAQTDNFWWVRELPGMGSLVAGPVLLERDGVRVRRATQNGRFRGYLASDRSGRLNHFHRPSPGFRGTTFDRHFFNRIDFSPAGRAACARR